MSSDGAHRSPEHVVEFTDPGLGLYGVIVVDALGASGRAFGGVRRMAYPDRASAYNDAARLARAMTHKCALANLPVGGAKTVLWVDGDDREHVAYQRLAEEVARLDGAYVCGPDVGTDEARLAVLRARTPWVNPVGNDPAGRTAQGVFAGLRAAVAAAFDGGTLDGRRVVVQGLGAVGLALTERLLAAGARVQGFDPDPARRAMAMARGAVVLRDEAALWSIAADVFSPCAVGGVFDMDRATRVSARVICGAANNVLVSPEVASVLHARGVLYVPDVMVNAGAVIEGVHTVLAREGTVALGSVDAAIEGTEARCRSLFAAASRAGVSPATEARRIAEQAVGGRGEASSA